MSETRKIAQDASDWTKQVDLLIRVTWPVLLGIAGWGGATLLDHGHRLVRIESTRYTRDQASHDIATIREIISNDRAAVQLATQRMESLEKSLSRALDLLEEMNKEKRK